MSTNGGQHWSDSSVRDSTGTASNLLENSESNYPRLKEAPESRARTAGSIGLTRVKEIAQGLRSVRKQ